MSGKPEFSILCPCFNHEKYVADFIKSVLAQSYQDWELIIVDDCSSDKSTEIIKSFNDERIKFVQHDYNKGVNVALNTAFENSCGNNVIFCASDDMLEPFALQKYKETYDKQKVEAVYINLSVIDENNQPRQDFENSAMPVLQNEPRHDFLRTMFFYGNALYGPGIAMSRKTMEKIYPLPPANSIYQDYKMNVEILGCAKTVVLPDKLVKYRVVNDGKSLSSNNFTTAIRSELEEASLMDSFLKIQDVDLLKEIFAQEIEKTGIIPYSDTIKFFLGRMALLSNRKSRQLWGYHKIMEFYNENLQKNILKDRYNFVYKDLLGLVSYFKSVQMINSAEKQKLKLLELIFSLKNLPDKKHKQLCILGCKFKIKRKQNEIII